MIFYFENEIVLYSRISWWEEDDKLRVQLRGNNFTDNKEFNSMDELKEYVKKHSKGKIEI